MTELRWILAALGAVVVAGVYVWSRRSATQETGPHDEERVAPSLDVVAPTADEPDPLFDADDLAAGNAPTAPMPLDVPASGDQLTIPMPGDPRHDEEDLGNDSEMSYAEPDRVIRLHVVARDDAPFLAADMVGALRAQGLRFAHHDLFHRFEKDGNPGPHEPPLFSVSDMLKPGTFDLETLADKELSGVSLFMGLPNPGDAVAVFAEMLATGRRLAATFGGLLVDEQGCAVSRQSASHMREDIINYQLEARRQDEHID